ncbi:MAG: DNA-processing protein DprA [Candidatus Dependentiae bacterium]|nr:DNA-processing protein DprA [Candidatus Dependentiae bacterium]
MNNAHIILHLSLIDGVGAATMAMTLTSKPESIELSDIYTMSEAQLRTSFGLTSVMASKIFAGLADTKLLARELALIAQHNIQWATIVCPEYPASLKNIHMLPPVLYWQGILPSDAQKAVALVGSRKANQYGQHVIEHLIPVLVKYHYAIISGGALGADSMAHRATINAGGSTVVVLGSGLLRPYPTSNRKLFSDVLVHGGAVVSAFPLETEAFAWNFPERNRIIAGLSRGSIVIQAAAKSGALITARFALDQGRDVFAVPGPINDPLSAGCHALIAQGAKLVTSAYDVLQEFGHIVVAPDEKAAKPQVQAKSPQQLIIQEEIDDSPQGLILRICAVPCSTDDLAVDTGLDSATLHALLFNLQLEGRVNQNFMGMWKSL